MRFHIGYCTVRVKVVVAVIVAVAVSVPMGRKQPNDFTAAERYATAHEDQQALAEMKKLFGAHDPAFLDLAMNPVFNRIRNLPAYEEMMQRIAARPLQKGL